MSWQAYVDTNLVGSGKVAKAAILGQQGGVWAASPGLSLSADEQKVLLHIHSDPVKARESGLRLAGQKYFAVQADERRVIGKKQTDGCVIVKTKQAILVAIHDQAAQTNECASITEALADYLISVGY